MKVCQVTAYSPREITGVGEVASNIGRGLEEKGHDYVILTKSSQLDGPGTTNLVEIDYRNIRLVGGILLVLGAAYWLLKERKGIDLLHLHSISWLTAIFSLLGRVLGIPRVLTLHGKFPSPSRMVSNAVFKLSERLALAHSSTVTCVSEDTRSHYGLDSARVVHNGIDTSRFAQNQEVRVSRRQDLGLGDSFVVLFIGRLDVNKGICELIEVIGSLVQNGMDLNLLIVGSGDDQMVEACLRENSLDDKGVMVGRAENPVPYYQSSDIFVLPSAFEGIPLTLLEAMACGLPCVATSVGGMPEVIVDGANGYLVQPGDKESLSQAILRVHGDKIESKGVSEKARITIENRFSSSRMLDDYLDVYGSLVKS
jgi:glycosyltransferase involved in cell wall biosynthesis